MPRLALAFAWAGPALSGPSAACCHYRRATNQGKEAHSSPDLGKPFLPARRAQLCARCPAGLAAFVLTSSATRLGGLVPDLPDGGGLAPVTL